MHLNTRTHAHTLQFHLLSGTGTALPFTGEGGRGRSPGSLAPTNLQQQP